MLAELPGMVAFLYRLSQTETQHSLIAAYSSR
jgi:hypothetical protein